MAFKSIKQYNDEKYKDLFILRNDKEYADVVFLYKDYSDVLIADVHYIKSDEYSGYVHCLKKGCPACAKGIKIQEKLFIPVYNITNDEIEFWDRNVRFENYLNKSVFENYPDPCKYVFRITRSGEANDMNTTYSIQVIGKNTSYSYDDILKKFNATMPDYYEHVCRDLSAEKMADLLTNSGSSDISELPSYQVTPRAAVTAQTETIPVPEATVLPDAAMDKIDPDDDIDDVTF